MAAPTIVQSNFVSSGTVHNTNPAPSLTGVTSGNTLMAILAFSPSGGGNGTTFAAPTGDSWPAAIASQPTANDPYAMGCQAWVLSNASAGTHTATFNNGTISAYYYAGLIEIAGSGSYDTHVATATANNTSTTLTVTSGTLANPTELAIALIGLADQSPTSNMGITDPPTGFTSLQVWQNATTNTVPGEVCYKATSATTSLSPNWTWTGVGAAAALIVTFQPPASPTATVAWLT